MEAQWAPTVPAKLDAAFCCGLAKALQAAAAAASADGSAGASPPALPTTECLKLLKAAEKLLKAEPTLVHADPEGAEVVVVGDLHGQYQDLLAMLELVGLPCDSRAFIFDGDFVDRGAWGLEVVLLLAAWKVAAPRRVWLVRGNHESTYCSWVYGFRKEVLAKFSSARDGEAIFAACTKLFAQLPLAAVVAGTALVLHGGLPRAPPRRATRRSLPAAEDAAVAIASLADIAAASKGGGDPDPDIGDQTLAADVLWSDPQNEPGVLVGARDGGVGIRFGPDVTEAFLRDNGLRLILRGHEGPDARVLRPDMPCMMGGHSLDHDTPSGKLCTVFSAPCYPQFGASQHQNLGAVAILEAPGYDQPRFVQYAAATRPEAPWYILEALQQEEAEEEDSGSAEEDADGSSSGSDGECSGGGDGGGDGGGNGGSKGEVGNGDAASLGNGGTTGGSSGSGGDDSQEQEPAVKKQKQASSQ